MTALKSITSSSVDICTWIANDLPGRYQQQAIKLDWHCRVTEADVRLYPTLIRFDSVYATLFKCSRRRVADYPGLKAWLRRMYNLRIDSQQSMQASLSGHGIL